MAKKTIGNWDRDSLRGMVFFANYCSTCREKVYLSKDEAQQFVNNSSMFIHRESMLMSFKRRVFFKLPKIRVSFERGGGVDNRVLTGNVESINMEYMKLQQKSQMSERTKKILERRSTGLSITELGKLFNLSRQRVWAILKEYGDTLPKELSTEADR